MANVSPGVYSKIIDLSTYVQSVPSTIGCIVALTKKGRDNQLIFVGSRAELISEWGQPNIRDYGKNYGQGLYEAYNFLGESGSLYFMRCLPDSAAYADIKLSVQLLDTDSTASVILSYVSSLNSKDEIRTNLETPVGAKVFPLCILHPIGRGDYYNGISIRITEHANPVYNGVYVLDIYEKQSDGNNVIIESFEVSFDPKAVDTSGDSIFITYVLNMYSTILRCEMELPGSTEENVIYADGVNMMARVYDKDIGTVSIVEANGFATLTDDKQDFDDWQYTAGLFYDYMVVVKDGRGNKIWGWLGTSQTPDGETIAVYDGRVVATATQSWCGDLTAFDSESADASISYEVKKSDASVGDAFISADPVSLKKGSDGTLVDDAGDVDFTVAKQLLSQGYRGELENPETGEIDDSIMDTENIYFTMVFDAGYPSDVKTQISYLVTTRRDCVAILDNGDNPTANAALTMRTNTHVFNNFYCALYECYSKIYDTFTGQDVWFSPVYHMSYLLPRNDNVAEIWYAAAGYNRAAIDNIKELRYNVKLGQRDQFYLKQINDIVKFSSGYVVWSQLTTQAKPSALQDLNIVRLVLYCKRSIEQFAKFFIFELNDEITWNLFNNQVINFLDQVKKKRGLYSYSVETSATEYEKKTKVFHCDIILEPTRVVEQIQLNFYIK